MQDNNIMYYELRPRGPGFWDDQAVFFKTGEGRREITL